MLAGLLPRENIEGAAAGVEDGVVEDAPPNPPNKDF